MIDTQDVKFVSIYCDGDDLNKLKIDWYPHGTTTPETETPGAICPTG